MDYKGIEFGRVDYSEAPQNQQSPDRINWWIREVAKTKILSPDAFYWLDYLKVNRN